MSKATNSARKALIWLAVIVAGMYAGLGAGAQWGDGSVTPELALDLAGGRQIIMQAVTEDGSEISPEDLEQAVEIIRRRVDASGVAEAEIATQGTDTIVVGLPGTPDEATVDLIRQSAHLQFRPVIVSGAPQAQDPDAFDEPTPSPSPSPEATTETTGPAASPEAQASEETAADPAEPAADELPQPSVETTDPSSTEWLNQEGLFDEYLTLDCTDPENLAGRPLGDPEKAYAACSVTGAEKFVLGPVELRTLPSIPAIRM